MFVDIFDCADALHNIQPSTFLISWFQPVLIGELQNDVNETLCPQPFACQEGFIIQGSS